VTVKILSFVTHAPKPAGAEEMIERALAWGVDVIAAQGTGTDWGAYWLGSGTQVNTEKNLKENVRPYLKVAVERKIPFVSSVGVGGADVHLEEALTRIDELCVEHGWALNIGVISGEISLDLLREKLASGVTIAAAVDHPDLSPQLTTDDIDDTIHAVGLLGPEPIMSLLRSGVDGVITGRALDIGLHMSVPMLRGIPRPIAAHAAKVIECGGVACEQGSPNDPIWAELDDTGFIVRSPNPRTPVTARSLAAHAFYERSNPWLEVNPGGTLDLRETRYEDLDDGTVRVEGAQWIDAPYSVLVEGARLVGYRTIAIMGGRDPQLIANLGGLVQDMQDVVDKAPQTAGLKRGVDFDVTARIYGHDAVLGAAEPHAAITGHEVAIIVDAVASTPELSEVIGLVAYGQILSGPYPGRTTTAGNVAFPYMPILHKLGPVYAFSMYHVLPLDDPSEPFRASAVQFPRTETSTR
jgi:hypothetical protein